MPVLKVARKAIQEACLTAPSCYSDLTHNSCNHENVLGNNNHVIFYIKNWFVHRVFALVWLSVPYHRQTLFCYVIDGSMHLHTFPISCSWFMHSSILGCTLSKHNWTMCYKINNLLICYGKCKVNSSNLSINALFNSYPFYQPGENGQVLPSIVATLEKHVT